MELTAILGMAVGLAMDAFAVALATSVSLQEVTRRHIFRFAFHFGLFQAMMPLLGWLAGRQIVEFVHQWDHWVAFSLLSLIGSKAIYEAIWDMDGKGDSTDPTRGWSLVKLSMATSIDAFAVGLSFAALRVKIWYPAVIIGIVTAGLTTFGMLVGGRLSSRFGRRMEILGGLILIAIGVKIVVDHGM